MPFIMLDLSSLESDTRKDGTGGIRLCRCSEVQCKAPGPIVIRL